MKVSKKTVPCSLAGEQCPSAMGLGAGEAGALRSSSPADMVGSRHQPRKPTIKYRLRSKSATTIATEMREQLNTASLLVHPPKNIDVTIARAASPVLHIVFRTLDNYLRHSCKWWAFSPFPTWYIINSNLLKTPIQQPRNHPSKLNTRNYLELFRNRPLADCSFVPNHALFSAQQ